MQPTLVREAVSRSRTSREPLEGVELLMGEAERGLFSRRGADYANSTYGDAPRFVASITKALVPS